MTKEGIVTIGILTGLILITMIIPGEEENESAKLSESAARSVEQKAQETENFKARDLNENTLKGFKLADKDIEIRNPFTLAHEKRGEAPNAMDMQKSDTPLNPSTNVKTKKDSTDIVKMPKTPKMPKSQKSQTTQTEVKPPVKWELTGVVIIGESKTAMISCGEKTVTLQIGGRFEDKTITAIEENYILYASDSGAGRLDLSIP